MSCPNHYCFMGLNFVITKELRKLRIWLWPGYKKNRLEHIQNLIGWREKKGVILFDLAELPFLVAKAMEFFHQNGMIACNNCNQAGMDWNYPNIPVILGKTNEPIAPLPLVPTLSIKDRLWGVKSPLDSNLQRIKFLKLEPSPNEMQFVSRLLWILENCLPEGTDRINTIVSFNDYMRMILTGTKPQISTQYLGQLITGHGRYALGLNSEWFCKKPFSKLKISSNADPEIWEPFRRQHSGWVIDR